MSEYYAVVRQGNTLAHYGVKGMKWGVRKALQKGNTRKVLRAYRRAERKLQRLNDKANISLQKDVAKRHNKRAKIALGVGAAGLGAFTGNRMLARAIANRALANQTAEAASRVAEGGHQAKPGFDNLIKSPRKRRNVGEGKGIYKTGEGLGTGPVGDGMNGLKGSSGSKGINPFKVAHYVSAGAGTAGLTAAAYQKARAMAAKRRTTVKGHAKAVAKRNEWERAMRETFRNTKYGTRKRKGRKSK